MAIDSKEIKDDLDRFENLIKMINFDYERFFAKLLKHPPMVYEREVNKLIAKYNLNQITNTTLRFRFNNLVARYLTFRDKWNKKMLEYEGVKKSAADILKTFEEVKDTDMGGHFFAEELKKLPENINRDKIEALILSKIDEFKQKGYKDIDVKIDIEEGKPKLRIRPIR
ncbi:hypothetical protein [Calditerrivibrio nitroreducens]|uniref:Uncharacterized protein n=1 Tax=Calditerrivibrio nitroreducens TaxID=477976 RepID=A0A2J6WME1_9BACT|nr:MAG: hypothetical protein C0187_03500 [Calditerrivibrio nitroreducens]